MKEINQIDISAVTSGGETTSMGTLSEEETGESQLDVVQEAMISRFVLSTFADVCDPSRT